MNGIDSGLPFEQFIQALTTQLDRAQRAMAIKAKNGNLPLTFAVKDLSLDLRTHVELRGAAVYIRPAGPNEPEASTIRLNLTTITRPMIEENAVALEEDTSEPSLDEVIGDDVQGEARENLRRRLEWAGIHRVSQLRRMQELHQEHELQRVTQLPISQLRATLARVSVPRLDRVVREPQYPIGPSVTAPPGGEAKPSPPALRISGENLLRGATPVVRLRGQAIPVLRATPQEIIVQPQSTDLSGTLALELEPGTVLETVIEHPAGEGPSDPPRDAHAGTEARVR